MSKFHIVRHVTVIQSTVVEAPTPAEAVTKSRKLDWKSWKAISRSRRKNYKAEKIIYS